MIKDKNMLTTRTVVDYMMLINMSTDHLKKYTEKEMMFGLAKELSKKVEVTERPGRDMMSKEFEARIVVLSLEEAKEINKEIKRLQKIEAAAVEATVHLIDNL